MSPLPRRHLRHVTGRYREWLIVHVAVTANNEFAAMAAQLKETIGDSHAMTADTGGNLAVNLDTSPSDDLEFWSSVTVRSPVGVVT